MPEWKDISLSLYKEFSIDCLFSKIFRYHLENQQIIEVQFKEWAMKHLWAIHHIDSRIDKNKLFADIDNGLSISHFRATPAMRKRLNDKTKRLLKQLNMKGFKIKAYGCIRFVRAESLQNSFPLLFM